MGGNPETPNPIESVACYPLAVSPDNRLGITRNNNGRFAIQMQGRSVMSTLDEGSLRDFIHINPNGFEGVTEAHVDEAFEVFHAIERANVLRQNNFMDMGIEPGLDYYVKYGRKYGEFPALMSDGKVEIDLPSRVAAVNAVSMMQELFGPDNPKVPFQGRDKKETEISKKDLLLRHLYYGLFNSQDPAQANYMIRNPGFVKCMMMVLNPGQKFLDSLSNESEPTKPSELKLFIALKSKMLEYIGKSLSLDDVQNTEQVIQILDCEDKGKLVEIIKQHISTPHLRKQRLLRDPNKKTPVTLEGYADTPLLMVKDLFPTDSTDYFNRTAATLLLEQIQRNLPEPDKAEA